ncbi:MAG TPA: phosphoglycerate kinase [Candidatus Moranbacteria bacterium]|nr:phosphoglycerate kinase [Candidatus Moranbacteria bacterium]
MRKIQDTSVENKKVIFRVGVDVSIEDGHAKEKFKIETIKEATDYLMNKKAKVALMTWLGRPKGERDMKFSVSQIKDDVENILGYKIIFVSDCIGEKVAEAMDKLKDGEIALLENVRFYPGEGDVETGKEYDEEFAKKLAENFDIFVNDAFSQSHRNQASIAGIPKFIPSYAGLLMQKEVSEMEKIKNDFARPAVAIIGGAKIETKLPVIKFFEEKYDYILVGGKIANEALDQKTQFSEKVILPFDFVDDPVKSDFASDHGASRLDIGPETLKKFKEIISSAKTIVWNGPTGKFEEEKYAVSSNEILKSVLASGAYTVVGGGETLEILEKNNAMDRISFVSTGGGAMLEYLAGGKMPGVLCLMD